MGFIWTQGPRGWHAEPLDAAALAIAADDPDGGAVLLLRSRGPAGEEWLLLAVSRHGVALNGAPLYTGIRALRDRDHVAVAGVGEMVFTSERLARVAAFPGSDKPMYCPRDRPSCDWARRACSARRRPVRRTITPRAGPIAPRARAAPGRRRSTPASAGRDPHCGVDAVPPLPAGPRAGWGEGGGDAPCDRRRKRAARHVRRARRRR